MILKPFKNINNKKHEIYSISQKTTIFILESKKFMLLGTENFKNLQIYEYIFYISNKNDTDNKCRIQELKIFLIN